MTLGKGLVHIARDRRTDGLGMGFLVAISKMTNRVMTRANIFFIIILICLRVGSLQTELSQIVVVVAFGHEPTVEPRLTGCGAEQRIVDIEPVER